MRLNNHKTNARMAKSAWVTKRNIIIEHHGMYRIPIYAHINISHFLFRYSQIFLVRSRTHTCQPQSFSLGLLLLLLLLCLIKTVDGVMCTSYNSNPSRSNLLLMAFTHYYGLPLIKTAQPNVFRLLFCHGISLSNFTISPALSLSVYPSFKVCSARVHIFIAYRIVWSNSSMSLT